MSSSYRKEEGDALVRSLVTLLPRRAIVALSEHVSPLFLDATLYGGTHRERALLNCIDRYVGDVREGQTWRVDLLAIAQPH